MPRARLSIHTLPAVAVAVLSLAVPLLASSDAPRAKVVQHAGSVEAREASVDPVADPAQAFAVGSADLQAARTVANAYWGRDACNGQVEFVWTVLDPGTNATASWRNPTDAWNNVGENFDCRVELNAQADYDFPKFCTVVTHEIGHLNGQQHAGQPGQLMSAYYSEAIPQCENAQPAAPAPARVAQPSSSAAVAAKTAAKPRANVQKRTLRKAAKRKAALAKARKAAKRRCVVRFQAGKRAKRCAAKSPKAGAAGAKRRGQLVARVVSVTTTS